MFDSFKFKNYDIESYINDVNNKLIIIISGDDNLKEIVDNINKNGYDVNIISISNFNWNDDLTPWKCDPIFKGDVGYKGKANNFINYIENDLLPYVSNKYKLKPQEIAITGYSLAGLFSLYASYNTNIFDAIISVSGSLWYPNIVSYIKNNKISNKTKFVYLSLGDKEANTKNEIMKNVYNNTKEIYEYFKNNDIKTMFVLNEGGHFNNPLKRQIDAIISYLDINK